MDSAGTFSNNAKGCGKGKKCTPIYPVRGVCPEGRHFPEATEWQDLFEGVDRKKDGLAAACAYCNFKDEYGFAGLLAGSRSFDGTDTVFGGLGSNGDFWTSTESDEKEAFEWGLLSNMKTYGTPGFGKIAGYSVRCVKDDSLAAANVVFHDPRDLKSYKVANIGGTVWMAQSLDFKTKESWCYTNAESYCSSKGRLYTWKAAQKACPSGWRLPTETEWSAVSGNIDRLYIQGSGFRTSDGKYKWTSRDDFWMSSSTGNKGNYYYFDMYNKTNGSDSYNKKGAKLVRCLKK